MTKKRQNTEESVEIFPSDATQEKAIGILTQAFQKIKEMGLDICWDDDVNKLFVINHDGEWAYGSDDNCLFMANVKPPHRYYDYGNVIENPEEFFTSTCDNPIIQINTINENFIRLRQDPCE